MGVGGGGSIEVVVTEVRVTADGVRGGVVTHLSQVNMCTLIQMFQMIRKDFLPHLPLTTTTSRDQ